MKNQPFTVALILVAILTATRVASAADYEEHFNTDTLNVTNTYPQYGLNITGSADVTNHQLRLLNSTSGVAGVLATTQSFSYANSDIHVELKLEGIDPGFGAVGLLLGTAPLSFLTGNDNSIEIFAGFSGVQVRVEGTGGFTRSETFVPAQGIMHALDIHMNGAGQFTLKLSEGTTANSFVPSGNSFSETWSNPSLASSYKIGFFLSTGVGRTGTGTFDNLIVVPEPTVCALLTTALGLLWFKARKR